MGIPSYFSYIIKNHSHIIRKKSKINAKFTSLYMDCNSIIYDCVRELEFELELMEKVRGNFDNAVIDGVILKIEHYIETIQPTNILYIAFDGVAPFAKMEQQRNRRYKTGYLSTIQNKFKNNYVSSTSNRWNTSAITPGTQFMNELSLRVKMHFSCNYFGSKIVIVSGSDEPGEGEHKMFQYIRSNALHNEIIAVYGLDADLIMLSLFHCFACKNIYIFRENPEFGKIFLNDFFDRDELLYLDNRGLSVAILKEMGIHSEVSTNDKQNELRGRIYDYVFVCFLLGNDFLPHFPALNIRTHGNYTILETYRKLFVKHSDRRFISLHSGNIQWKWVKLFLNELAKEERNLIINEYESRLKMEKRFYPTNTSEEKEIAFDNIPTIYRAEEHYIQPNDVGWEERYYKVAFGESLQKNDLFIERICNNYLEGLEWTFKYYTEECPHWRWKYDFHYPPLLSDLIKYIPNFETTFINESSGINLPFHPNTQLAFVIPICNHHLLKRPEHVLDKQFYVDLNDLKFQWTFCKFFWESHAILPDVPLSELEKLDSRIIA